MRNTYPPDSTAR